jgi:hypothetical protein
MLSPKLCKLASSGTGRGASGPRVVVVVVLPENVVVVDVVDVEDVDVDVVELVVEDVVEEEDDDVVDVVVEESIVVVEDVVVVDDRGTNVVVVLEVMDGQGHPTMLLHSQSTMKLPLQSTR